MITKILIVTLLIELLTIFSRRFFGSVQEKFKKSKFKYKVRIHHGYIGGLIATTALFVPFQPNMLQENLLILGMVLFLSDAIHHFIILPVWIGRTEFP